MTLFGFICIARSIGKFMLVEIELYPDSEITSSRVLIGKKRRAHVHDGSTGSIADAAGTSEFPFALLPFCVFDTNPRDISTVFFPRWSCWVLTTESVGQQL
jgi:hypothetical protein